MVNYFPSPVFSLFQQALDKKIENAFQNAEKELEKFKKINFACEADVLLTAERWYKELPFHSLTDLAVVAHPYFNRSGRPQKGAVPDGYHYRLSAQLALQGEKVDLARLHAGRFILATNVLDPKTLTDEQILSEYKAQQATERGFRFLKDPLFFALLRFFENSSSHCRFGDGYGFIFIGLYPRTTHFTPIPCSTRTNCS
jgi:transposase